VGKSSLLNALAGREAALVADMPGTTRDAVAVNAVLDGLAVRLVDAPGLDPAEADPVVRAASAIAARFEAAADLVLRCTDGLRPPPESARPSLLVRTKADLPAPGPATAGLAVSARSGTGLDVLAVAVRRSLVPDAALEDERPWSLPPPCGAAR
jgi:tRNA modification GTPase